MPPLAGFVARIGPPSGGAPFRVLGQGSTAAQIDAVVTQLEKERVVWVVGDAVMYPGTPAQ